MSIFDTAADVEVQVEKDSVGFEAHASGLYTGKVKTAFIDAYNSGSYFMEVVYALQNEKGATFEYSEREVVWSAKTKGDFYIDKKTGAKRQLIGKSKMETLAKLTTGKSLKELEPTMEKKFHNVWNSELGKEAPKELVTITSMIDQELVLGLLKIEQNKQVKAGMKYVDTAEIITVNEINKFFSADKKTLSEIEDEEPATFHLKWEKTNAGKTRNKVKKVEAASGIPTAAPAAQLDL